MTRAAARHESPGNIAKIFREASDNAPAILFCDEIDAPVPISPSSNSKNKNPTRVADSSNTRMKYQLLIRARDECCEGGGGNSPDNVPWEIHHKNGDPSGNRKANLKISCRSCHENITYR